MGRTLTPEYERGVVPGPVDERNPKYENTIEIKYNIIDTPKISGRNRDNDTTTLKIREKMGRFLRRV
mgnify:CR=1 FL=1